MGDALEGLYGTTALADGRRDRVTRMLHRGLRAVAAAGAELIQLNLLFDDAEQMERLAAEVIPAVAPATP